MVEILIERTDEGYKSRYENHSWSEVSLIREENNYKIIYKAFDANYLRSRHEKPIERVEKRVSLNTESALEESLEILKRNIEGVILEDINFRLD